MLQPSKLDQEIVFRIGETHADLSHRYPHQQDRIRSDKVLGIAPFVAPMIVQQISEICDFPDRSSTLLSNAPKTVSPFVKNGSSPVKVPG